MAVACPRVTQCHCFGGGWVTRCGAQLWCSSLTAQFGQWGITAMHPVVWRGGVRQTTGLRWAGQCLGEAQ